MTVRERIIEKAVSQAGVKYHDHSMLPNVAFDCAGYPLWVYMESGVVPKGLELPKYSPHQWLKREEDHTYLDFVLNFMHEIPEEDVLPGDLVLYKLCASWTHGAIVISWPEFIMHPVRGLGIIGSHGTEEGFIKGRPRRFFTYIDEVKTWA